MCPGDSSLGAPRRASFAEKVPNVDQCGIHAVTVPCSDSNARAGLRARRYWQRDPSPSPSPCPCPRTDLFGAPPDLARASPALDGHRAAHVGGSTELEHGLGTEFGVRARHREFGHGHGHGYGITHLVTAMDFRNSAKLYAKNPSPIAATIRNWVQTAPRPPPR